jgi:hypothetical protein
MDLVLPNVNVEEFARIRGLSLSTAKRVIEKWKKLVPYKHKIEFNFKTHRNEVEYNPDSFWLVWKNHAVHLCTKIPTSLAEYDKIWEAQKAFKRDAEASRRFRLFLEWAFFQKLGLRDLAKHITYVYFGGDPFENVTFFENG